MNNYFLVTIQKIKRKKKSLIHPFFEGPEVNTFNGFEETRTDDYLGANLRPDQLNYILGFIKFYLFKKGKFILYFSNSISKFYLDFKIQLIQNVTI